MRDSTVEQPARKSKRSTAIARKSVRPIACIKLLNLRPDTKLINAIAASMTNRTIRHPTGCTSYRHCVASQMEDRFGHRINYLRVSITDRCNERCLYCMPHELQEWIPRSEILNFDEITRLVL